MQKIHHQVIEQLHSSGLNEHGPDMAFLMSALGFFSADSTIQKETRDRLLCPLLDLELDSLAAVKLTLASRFCASAEGELKCQRWLGQPQIQADLETMRAGKFHGYFDGMMRGLVLAFLESLVLEGTESSLCIQETALEAFRVNLEDLRKTPHTNRQGRLLPQDQDKLYFTTHILMIATVYYTVPLKPSFFRETTRTAMIAILHNFTTQDPNLNPEEFAEAATALIALGAPLTPTIQAAARGWLKTPPKLWPPQGSDAYTEMHTVVVIVTFLRHFFQPSSELTNRGFTIVRGQLTPALERLQKQCQQEQKYQKLLIAQGGPTAEPEVVVPQKLRQSPIQIPAEFWPWIHQRLSTALGGQPIHLLQDQTYLRIMRGAAGNTKPHADFFFFIRKTQVFQALPPQTTPPPAQHPPQPCFRCRVNQADTKNSGLCGACAERGIFPVFTAWLSLGNYNPKTHSLLEFCPKSHQASGFEAALQFGADHPRLPKNCWEPAKPITAGEIVVFHCKTTHRAQSHRNSQTRASLDIRFVMGPC